MAGHLRLQALAIALAATASPAYAHLTNTGFGPFYDGLTHLFVTPENLLQGIALSLLAGLRGPRFGRAVLFALPSAWLVGTLSGRLSESPVTLPAAIAALITIVLGALVAADWPLKLAPVAGCAIVVGLLNGGVDGIELAKVHFSAQAAAGAAIAPFLLVALLAGNVASVRAQWVRIAVRVAGSWIAASGLFMLGWALRRV
jgi:hydrogenase/urease accessory protein HupE